MTLIWDPFPNATPSPLAVTFVTPNSEAIDSETAPGSAQANTIQAHAADRLGSERGQAVS